MVFRKTLQGIEGRLKRDSNGMGTRRDGLILCFYVEDIETPFALLIPGPFLIR